jgi:pimeloyl-ACP methyl ester carboxylesterase
MKFLASTGWSFDERLWEPLASKLAPHAVETVDPLEAGEAVARLSAAGESFWLLGFSLGAFLLYPHLAAPGVQGGVFCALAQAFIQGEGNPFGAPKRAVLDMEKSLKTDAHGVVEAFRKQAFKPMAVPPGFRGASPTIDGARLEKGLDLLLAADLSAVEPKVPVHLVQGNLDRILSVEGARAMARAKRCFLNEINGGGHMLPISHASEIALVIQGALGESR